MSEQVMSWEDFCKEHYNSYPILNKKTKNILCPDNKLDFRSEIINYWKKSRDGKTSPNPSALEAMEELHEQFPEHSMKIINFTNRNRKDIRSDLKRKEFHPKSPKEFIFEVRGLDKVIQEWDKQVIDSSTRDSLEDLILSKPELYSKPEYRITAIVHRVRRLRKGYKKNPGNLQLADSMLKTADDLLEESGNKARDHAIIPSGDNFGIMIKMQKHLNDTRRGLHQIEPGRLEGFTKQLKELSDGDECGKMPGIIVYYWWALRISYTRARANIQFDEARKFLEKMDKVKELANDEVRAYIKCLEEAEKSGVPRDIEIAEYHKALAEFIFRPKKSLTGTEGKLRNKKDLLYRSALGNPKATSNANLFSWHLTTPKTALIKRCRRSIMNAKTCCSQISYGNSYSAHAMLILVSVDLLIKIRWFLSGSGIYKTVADWGTVPNRSEGGKSEMELAEEFKQEIIHTLKEVRRQTIDSGDLQNLIVNWVQGLEQLDFIDKENYASEKDDRKLRGPLGQLCDICGKMVGWGWDPIPTDEEVKSVVWDKNDELILHEFSTKGGPALEQRFSPKITISTKGPINNPYLRQVGESSSHS